MKICSAAQSVDALFPEKALAEIRTHPAIEPAQRLQFDIDGV